MSKRVNTTLSIAESIKLEFKIQTTIDGIDMSDAVENMMVSYVRKSKEMHKAREDERRKGRS